jgi:uncharacterized protein involved in propanediol utilization
VQGDAVIHQPAAARPPVHCRRAPGTCGELLQGFLAGRDFMVNCPIDLYATAHARASGTPGLNVRNAGECAKVLERLAKLGAEPMPMNPDQFDTSSRRPTSSCSSHARRQP